MTPALPGAEQTRPHAVTTPVSPRSLRVLACMTSLRPPAHAQPQGSLALSLTAGPGCGLQAYGVDRGAPERSGLRVPGRCMALRQVRGSRTLRSVQASPLSTESVFSQ